MTFVKKALSALALLALAACSGMMGGGSTVNVNLSGAQEVPPVATQASGNGSFTIAQDGSVSGRVSTTGMNAVAAHIHQGARGQNGPVAVPLSKGADGSWSPAPGAKLNEAQMSAFKAGNLYVNVHSPSNKGGEIRDQLTP
jgi:CHRD domain-containing protein